MDILIALGSIFLGIAMIVGLWFVSVYNLLVPMRERCRAASSDIETQIARRVDLYFNATRVLENGSDYERSVFVQVAQIRGRTDLSALQKAGEIGKLLAIAESNPNITATKLFANMQKMIAETESFIQERRQEYNNCARAYNAARLEFPNNLVAGMMGFGQADYFELTS